MPRDGKSSFDDSIDCGTGPISHLRAAQSLSLKACAVAIVVAALAAIACGPPSEPLAPAAPAEWREFEGTWNASGARHTIALGPGRTSSTSRARSMTL